MKKYIYPLAITATALFATACSDDETISVVEQIPDSQKEMISFSLSDGAATTRAGFMEGSTRILMRIQSDDRHSTSPGSARYTRALATAAKDEMDHSTADNTAKAYSTVSTNDDPRYWDDAYGRYGQLSVYAIAIANKNDAALLPLNYMYDGSGAKSTATNTTWGSSASSTDNIDNNTISFSVDTSAPTCTTIENQDLVYSNNIQADGTLGKDGVYRYDFTAGKYPDNTGLTNHTAGRMIFAQKDVLATAQPTDATGKFDKGHMVFNHALSRITVEIKEGAGFNTSSTDDFKFTNSTNIKLLGMNTTGTLDVKAGTWTPGTATAIAKMAPISFADGKMQAATFTNANGVYMAQMLPGYTFTNGDNTNVMEFEIDNNTYYVTQDMLFDALTYDADGDNVKDDGDGDMVGTTSPITMAQGKNYRFTITVKKTGVAAITATLAKWVDVDGYYQIDNSHITVTTKKLEGTEGSACREFNLYRWGQILDKIYTDDSYTAAQYSGNYLTDGAATKSETADGSNIWNTKWFYENNKTAYHFRTLNNIAANGAGSANTNISNTTGDSPVSSFSMTSGPQSTQDYHWGAPMVTDATLVYNTETGFTSNLHKGIVAPKNGTDKTINITELHMMSNINISLITDSVTSPKGLGPAAVNLENATITLTRFAKTASVDMGTGLITPTYTAPTGGTHSSSDSDCAEITKPSFTAGWWTSTNSVKASTSKYSYAVVPQALRRNTSGEPTEADCVGITITTSDNNQYYVIKDLAEIQATSVSNDRNQSANSKIVRWFPGHTYNYTIKITKKGIEAITCTVADWVTVTAANKDITLED